ncbi:MAG: hypothetical protein M1824_004423 [Vezdaea acicularis]|nr:MAG: hypothetical protein M1824_004423 [Vezdaea acicularis]
MHEPGKTSAGTITTFRRFLVFPVRVLRDMSPTAAAAAARRSDVESTDSARSVFDGYTRDTLSSGGRRWSCPHAAGAGAENAGRSGGRTDERR